MGEVESGRSLDITAVVTMETLLMNTRRNGYSSSLVLFSVLVLLCSDSLFIYINMCIYNTHTHTYNCVNFSYINFIFRCKVLVVFVIME